MNAENQIRIADYLALRLQELGIDKFFGVPGNHLGPFISAMEETTRIKWAGGTNEINMGYAVDGYARIRGVGAVGVTYGVGALSLINPISGAFVEHVPIVVINASPTYEQILNFRHVGLLTSHMSTNELSNINAYRQVTADAQKITNASLAPSQIDSALTACISSKQPVYLEVCENVWAGLCQPPNGKLQVALRPGNQSNTESAVKATVERMNELGDPIFWLGNEVNRLGLEDDFIELIDRTGIPYCSTIMAKSTISEEHPLFHGVYNGKASDPSVWFAFKEVAQCRIGIGAWSTSKNLGGTLSVGEDWLMAARDGVSVGSDYFPNVMLRDFIPALTAELPEADKGSSIDYYAKANENDARDVVAVNNPKPVLFTNRTAFLNQAQDTDLHDDKDLTYDDLFTTVDQYLEQGDKINSSFVVADAGFSLLGAQTLTIKRRAAFHSQASWLSIGYSVGAVVGMQQAHSNDEQALVFVGDGSFQETAQAISDLTRTGTRNIVFVLNNQNFYGIEQMLVDACFYRGEREPDIYNLLHPWNYEKLAEVFHTEKTPCHGRTVSTVGELVRMLEDRDTPGSDIHDGTLLLRVVLDRNDYPKAIRYKVDEKRGEM